MKISLSDCKTEISPYVMEAEYKIAKRGISQHFLETENIECCVAFAGSHPESGLVFLYHINSPKGIKGQLNKLEEELKNNYNLQINDFNLYYAGGIRPFSAAFILSCLILVPCLTAGHSGPYALITFITLLSFSFLFFKIKAIGLHYALFNIGINFNRCRCVGYTHIIPKLNFCKVTIDANDSTNKPIVECYKKPARKT